MSEMLASLFNHAVIYETETMKHIPGEVILIDRVLLGVGFILPFLSFSFFTATKPIPKDAHWTARDTKFKAFFCLVFCMIALPFGIFVMLIDPNRTWVFSCVHSIIKNWAVIVTILILGLGVFKWFSDRSKHELSNTIKILLCIRFACLWIIFIASIIFSIYMTKHYGV